MKIKLGEKNFWFIGKKKEYNELKIFNEEKE